MISKSRVRVEDQTSPEINRRIYEDTQQRIQLYSHLSHDRIRRRLGEIDDEWDIERALEAHAAVVSLAGIVLGRFVHRFWYFLPVAAAGFLLQHAVQGWYPMVPVFRRLGFRTPREIEEERRALAKGI